MRLREDRMSGTERLEALFERRMPDRVSVGGMATVFSSRNAGYNADIAYGEPKKSFEAMFWTAEQYGWDPVLQYFGHTVLGALDFGGAVRLPQGEFEGGMVIESFPVITEQDVENLTLPDPKKAGRIPQVMEFSRLQESHGLPVWFFSRSPFTMAANTCGVEQFLKWMIRKPQLCERLMTLVLDHIGNVLQYWIDSFGVDNVYVLMSSPTESNQVISPRHFEKYALPFHAEYHTLLKDLGIEHFAFHICGDQNLNLPYLADLAPWPHPSILSFGHEVDLEAAARYFPEDIIYGNIEPSLFVTQTPTQIYEHSREIIEKGRRSGSGFILGPGCGLQVASAVNVFAMTKAINDFGWYE